MRETDLHASHLVQPLFVRPGEGVHEPIPSMPGCHRHSVDVLVKDVIEITAAGVPAVLLFGIPESKDAVGSEAYAEDGIIPRAVRALKAETDAYVITDVCLCGYTDHGHCGVVEKAGDGDDVQPRVLNDASLELLARQAVAHARAGADMVAPSDMMDGRDGVNRTALDDAGLADTPIMAYSAKFASAFYGPFRDAAESPPQFGDRRTYQMDPANADEALREVFLDIEEGADIVMVKPALAYLDLIRRVKEETGHPVAAYSVSGEFSMVEAAAERGWVDRKQAALEILTGIRRAGADIIISYWAHDAARWLTE